MKKDWKNIIVSKASEDDFIHAVRMKLWEKCGTRLGDNLLYPLAYHIFTGRATLEFEKRLLATRPYLIARDLSSGGSDADIIRKIKKRIGYSDSH